MVTLNINVTQLKCACQDTEWRIRWLNGENPPAFSLPSDSYFPVHGKIFHQLAEQFVNWLFNLLPGEYVPTSYQELWDQMWDRFANLPIHHLLEENADIESVNHLVECLKSFCNHLEFLHNLHKAFSHWNQVFIVQEFSIDHIALTINEDIIFLSGRVDAVRIHPKRGLEVVDYKLSQGKHREQDLLQIAIYSQMLKMKKAGLTFHGLLEYYNPNVTEECIDQNELDLLFRKNIIPILEEILNYKKNESTIQKKKHVEPVTKTKAHSIDAETLSQKIINCYSSFNLKVEVIGSIEAPQLIRFQLQPGNGVKTVSLVSRADDLMVQLRLPFPPHIHAQQGFVAIDIPKEKPQTILLMDVLDNPSFQRSASPLVFPVGVDIKNELVIADLADTNTCHALIGGMTGSGKSEFMKSMIYSLMVRNDPQWMKFLLIDPKLLTFSVFQDIPYLIKPLITDLNESIECLKECVDEMNNRYKQLSVDGYDQLKDRFLDGKKDIPFLIIVIDEFGDLILSNKDRKKEFENLIAQIAQKGRASGIHLVLATQRPEVKVVTGLIKANLPLKICLRVNTQKNSEIILDQSGGQNLLGKGDLLCDLGKGLVRAQSPFIPTNVLKNRLTNISELTMNDSQNRRKELR